MNTNDQSSKAQAKRTINKVWLAIGGLVGFVAFVGVIITGVQLWQSVSDSRAQNLAHATLVAVLEAQYHVQSEMATLQAEDVSGAPTATAVDRELVQLEKTIEALERAKRQAEATLTPTTEVSLGETATSTNTIASMSYTPTPTLTVPPSLTDTPTPTLTVAVSNQLIAVPDAIVNQFFSPGPSPAALAVAGDFLWVADKKQRLMYQLDSAGIPLASFPITPTGEIRGLAWDGEALRLALGGYQANQVVRLDTAGTVLESFPLPVWPIGLCWDLVEGTLWTVSGDFLLEFNTDGRLLQTLHTPVVGSADALAWATDGMWLVDTTFGDWYRSNLAGEQLRRGDLPAGDFPCNGTLAWDERGYLWLVVEDDRRIYQISLRQEEAEIRATLTPGGIAELALPRPQLEPAPATDRAIVHMTNNLQGTLSLSFGDESRILQPGDTWSAELDPKVYTVYASSSVPEPIAFSGKELLVSGYEHTWSLKHPD